MGGRWSRLIREEGFLAIVVLIANVANFAYHVYMSHALDDAQFGALQALLSLLFVLSIPTMTIQASLAQFIATKAAVGDLAGARAIFADGLKWMAAFAVCMTLLVAAAAKPIANFQQLDRAFLPLLLAVLVGGNLIMPVVFGGLQGQRRFPLLGGVIVLSMVLKLGLGVGFVVAGWQAAGAMGGIIVSTLITVVIGGWGIRQSWRTVQRDPNPADLMPMLRYAIPAAFGFLALSPFANFDVFLIKGFLSVEEAGQYSRAMLLGKAFLFLPAGAVLALFPNVAQAAARQEDTRALLLPALGAAAAITLAGAALCFLVPQLFARFLLGNTDPALVQLVRWVGFAVTPVSLCTILLQYHLARRHWIALPGMLLGGGSYLVAIVLRHESPLQVLALLGICGGVAFCAALVNVWWPESHPTSLPDRSNDSGALDGDLERADAGTQ